MDNKEKIIRGNLKQAKILGNKSLKSLNVKSIEDYEQELKDYLLLINTATTYRTIDIEYHMLSEFDAKINKLFIDGWIYVDSIKETTSGWDNLHTNTIIFKIKNTQK